MVRIHGLLLIILALTSACSAKKDTVTHQGWSNIKAVGRRTPPSYAFGLGSLNASVTITWKAMRIESGSVPRYNVYRGTSSGVYDAVPLAVNLEAGSFQYYSCLYGSSGSNNGGSRNDPNTPGSFTDCNVTPGQTYYYQVRPTVDLGEELIPPEAYSEVRVTVPPDNMVLVHRWMANQDLCELMGKTPDPSREFGCSYQGPGSINGYLDLGKSIFVDAYEMGCNYSGTPGSCSLANGCIDILVPGAAQGVNGDVFYNRNFAECDLKSGGVWSSATAFGAASDLSLLSSNKPGLPPLVGLPQAQANLFCEAHSKRLLTHREQIIAGAWSSTLDISTIFNLETGSGMPSSHACNTQFGFPATFDNNAFPNDAESLPGAIASGIRSLRTGSNATNSCVSRYGVQDLTGNVSEWSSDQLQGCTATDCQGGPSPIDPTNMDWNGFRFDGVSGSGGAAVTEWDLRDQSFSSTYFLVPLGLPMVAPTAAFPGTQIGSETGQFSSYKFNMNHFRIMIAASGSRGAFAGGAWDSIFSGGRYALDLSQSPIASSSKLGFRCVMDAN